MQLMYTIVSTYVLDPGQMSLSNTANLLHNRLYIYSEDSIMFPYLIGLKNQ